MKYKRTIVGRPYVPNARITEGFVEGVGYFKNFLAHRSTWCFVSALFVFAFSVSGYKLFKARNMDADDRFAMKETYTVRRREDVEDPSRDCYN